MTFTEKTIEEFKGILAQAYCSEKNEKKELDSELLLEAEKIAVAFIITALAKQKEEILKALPEEKAPIFPHPKVPLEEIKEKNYKIDGYNQCLQQVRDAISKL